MLEIPVLKEGGRQLSDDEKSRLDQSYDVAYESRLVSEQLVIEAAEEARLIHATTLAMISDGVEIEPPFVIPNINDRRIVSVYWGSDPDKDAVLIERIRRGMGVDASELFLAATALSSFHRPDFRDEEFNIYLTGVLDSLGIHLDYEEASDSVVKPLATRSILHLEGERVLRLSSDVYEVSSFLDMDPGDAYTLPYNATPHGVKYTDAVAIYVQD